MSRLAELAIASLDDPDASVVLGDFILENRWHDFRVRQVMGLHDEFKVTAWHAARPTVEFARAVVAVLLFGEWPDTAYEIRFGGSSNLHHWPAVAACWVPNSSMAAQFEQLVYLMENDMISREQARDLMDMPDPQAASSSGSGRR